MTLTIISNYTPKSQRIHIGIFGRRNVGKSSLLNLLTGQETSIVSPTAGTTTDPVEKTMELRPLGPVLFIDTPGIDDEGNLGTLRTAKTHATFDRCDIAILVAESVSPWGPFEDSILHEFQVRNIPFFVVLNKVDLAAPSPTVIERLKQQKIPYIEIFCVKDFTSPNVGGSLTPSLTLGANSPKNQLIEAMIRVAPETALQPPPIVSDLVSTGSLVVLVVPVDTAAPKGRLILPQVQTIRDILDNHGTCVVTQVEELPELLARFLPEKPPSLVVTDSQAFDTVHQMIPTDMPLTSFSILFARQKGDLFAMAEAARKIGTLTSHSRILIAESCTHHPTDEDIGSVKIPNLLRKRLGDTLTIQMVRGHEFPAETLSDWDLIIHCGACVWNRREMLSRLFHAGRAGVPLTNYGLAIAFLVGILDRAIQPLSNRDH